eukprot:2599295-Pyramimonas_sp.AAC.1
MPEDAWDLGEQRYRRPTSHIPCRDRPTGVCIKPHCGGLIGDPYMARNLAASFAPCMQRWVQACNDHLDRDHELYGRSELCQQPVYVGLAMYAGDLREIILGGAHAGAPRL